MVENVKKYKKKESKYMQSRSVCRHLFQKYALQNIIETNYVK